MLALKRDSKILYADLTEDSFRRLVDWLKDQPVDHEYPNPSGNEPQYWVEVSNPTPDVESFIMRMLADG